jgi:hypothetical protein
LNKAHLWFGAYYSELLPYEQRNVHADNYNIKHKSGVNENIEQYLEEQEKIKVLAKWWQFRN